MALTIDEINKMDNEVNSLLAPFGVNTNDNEEFEYETMDDVINNANNQNSLSDDEFNEMEQVVNASLSANNKNINDLTAKNKELFYFEDETNSKALDSMVEIPDETLALYGLKKDTSFIKNYFTQEQWEEWQNKGKIGVQEAWNRKKKYEMIPFVGTSMDTGLSVKNLITFNRLKNGESVRPEDEEELKKYILEMAEIEARGGYTFGGGTLDIITGSIPYMLEFGAGLATVPAEGVGLGLLSKTFSTLSAKKAASTAVKKGVKGAIAKEVVKQIPKVVTSSAKFGVTKMPQHFIGSIADKQLDTGIYITPVGDTIFTDSENIALSIMKALGETTFETMSETSGFMFAPIAKYISKPVRNLLPKTFYTNFDKLIQTKFGKSSSEVLKKYGYDGVLEEMGEELLNRFLCQTFGINGLESYTLDGFLNNVFYANDPSKWGQEALSFALTSGGAHSLMAGSAKLKGSVEKYYMQQGYIRTKGSESLAQQELRKMLQKNNVDESVINNYFATHTEDDFRQALYTFKSSEISSELDKKEFELEEQSNQVKDNVFKLLVEKGFDEEQADSYSRLFKARSKMVAKNWGDVNAIDWLNNLGLQIDNEQQKTLADGSPVRADSVSYEQSAMYASKAKNFDEFYNKVLSSDKNIKSKEQYNLKTKGNNYFRIPFDTVLHDKNGHSLTKEQWNEFLENIDNPIDFEISSKPRFAGKPILLKVKTNSAYYGAVIETFEKNNPIITTVFKDTEKNIDNWLKKERPSQTRNTSAVTTKGLLLSKGLTNIITNVQPNYNPNVKYNEQYLRSENIGSEVSKINISQLMNGNKPQSLTDNNTIPQQTDNLNPNVANLEENIKKNFNDSVENIIEYVKADILNILHENDISEDEFSLQDIKIYGSYAKGKNKDTSDLDIIVQYTGVMSEDGAFNILNDEKLTIQDVNGRTVEIDINPVNVEKSGTIDENLKYFDNLENNTFYQSAYHGTPHKFDEFSTSNIGTGEGAQVHGWGLYFAENKNVSEEYRKTLSDTNGIGTEIEVDNKTYQKVATNTYRNKDDLSESIDDYFNKAVNFIETKGSKKEALKYIQNQIDTNKDAGFYDEAVYYIRIKDSLNEIKQAKITKYADDYGQLFEVDIPENDVLLDEDKTLTEQNKNVKNAIFKINRDTRGKLNNILARKNINQIVTGRELYEALEEIYGSAKLASEKLNEHGIKGITYDGRQDGRCYVVFDDKAINVLQTFYQEGSNVVDLTSDFEKTPTIDEVKTYINQIVENGTKFATLSPDWFVDVKGSKRTTGKILNKGNYKGLNKKETSRYNKYIMSLEKLLANAQYIGEKDNTKKDKKPNVEKYHYFKTNVKIGDKTYEIIFDTEEYINENPQTAQHANRVLKPQFEDTNSITENNNGFNPKTVHLYNITELKKAKYYQNNNDFTQNIFGEKKVNIDSKEAYDNFIDNFSSEETRAAITFENNALNSPKAIIHLFENADKSSFLHEVGHLFLQDIINAAKTNEYAKRELEAINKMLGHTQGEYTRAEHEKFAKGFEIYLMNGKAPNAGLKSAFDTFKSWLREIYNFVLASNGALSQDVYSVYDSLFKDYNPDDMEVVKSIVRNAYNTSNSAKDGKRTLNKAQKRYKETAYDILAKALGKNKTYLKNILENKATKKNAKAREEIENKIANISDEISSSDGMLPEWKEFFADNNIGDNSETKSDYELVQKAYDVIVNKSYLDYDSNYNPNEIDPALFEKYEKAYNYILDIYRNGNEKQKDYAVAAMYEWLDNSLPTELYQELFTEMFEQDFQELERIANLDKFGKVKEKISNAAKLLSYSDTKHFNKLVTETLKSLDFLTSKDKTIILSNLMQYKTTEEIRNNLDEIMDIAKILDSQNYFNRVETKIQKALKGTKNVKQGNKTVGKYTKEINDVFADLRRFNNMTQERAAQELETMNMFEGEETDSLSFEDKLRRKFLYYKATPNMYISSDFISDLYKDILTLKNYGYLKKEQDKFMRKVNIDSKIEKLLRVLDKKKKGGFKQNKNIKTNNQIDSKEKYTSSENVYDNFVEIHKNNGLIEKAPEYWNDETVEEACKYLGIKDEKGVKIKSPIDEITIYKSHIEHLINDNNSYRKKYLNRAIETIRKPNIIVKSGVYNNYIKLFFDNENRIKPHLQIVKIKKDGNFYVTTLKPTKQQIKKIIIEGQVLYDLASVSSTLNTDTNIITNNRSNFKVDDKKLSSKLIGGYIRLSANWESALNAIFNNDIKEEYSLLDKEAEVQVWQNQQKQEFLNEAMKIFGVNQYKFDNLMIDKLAEKFTFVEYGAKRTHKIEMNKMDIILAYIWSKNPNLKERLERQFTQQGLYDMFSNLDNEEIEFANLLQKTASKFYNEANKVYIQKYGIELPRVQNYFPSKTERTSVVDLLADFSFQSAASPSFIKNRVVSNMPTMKFSNPLTLLFSHIDKMGVFIKMTETIDLYNKVFTDTDIKKTITELYGKETYESFATMLANSSYQKQAVKSDGVSKIFDNMVTNFISSKIILKPSIMIKQLFSTVNYAENMPVTTWCAGFLKAVSNPKATINFMMSDEYLKSRFSTGSQNEFLKHAIENSKFAKTRKFIDFCSMNVKLGDIGAIIFGGKPYIDYLMNVKGMTKEAAFKEFRLSTMRSQQASMASSLSNFQNNFNNPFVRGYFSFRNTPNQYFRKVADSIISYANGDTSKSQMAKTIFIYTFLNAFVYNTATSLSLLAFALNGGGDDDDLKKDIIKSFFDFNSQGLPGIGELWTIVYSLILLREMPQISVSMPALDDVFEAIQRVSAEDVTLEEWINALAVIGDTTTGLPVQTTVNMLGGVGDIAQGNIASGALRTVGYTKKRSQKTTGEED